MKKQPPRDTAETQAALLEPVIVPPVPPASSLIGSTAASPRTPDPRSASFAHKRHSTAPVPSVKRFAALHPDDDVSNRQAELFYLQKQIQQQTPMIFILEDGERIQGVIEWYDRHSIKVRGKSRVLIYKSAIKYLYKAGEVGSAPDR